MKLTSSLSSTIRMALLGTAGGLALASSSAFGLPITPTTSVHGFAANGVPDNELFYPANTTGDVLLGATIVPGIGVGNTLVPSQSLSGLVDGNIGSDGGVDSHVYFNYPNGTYSFLIDLPTATNLFKLQSIAGWTTDRINQFYTLSYTTDVAPTLGGSFTTIGSVAYNPGNDASLSGTESSTQVQWGDGTSSITGGQAATGLLFQFDYTGSSLDGVDNDPLLREIQAYAVQVVPEPSTYAMMILGFGLLAFGSRFAKTRRNLSI